jgi:mono/diheme cytochrome c family protein
MIVLAFLAVGSGLAFGGPVVAQTRPGNAGAGHEIAQTWCSNCHVIDRRSGGANDAVPSFPAIADMSSTTVLSLQAFLQTSHGGMPNFQLTRNQVDDVVAYIISLKMK